MTATSNEVAVIQADRDIAHEIMQIVRGYRVNLPHDRHWLIDMVARHRIAHSDPRPVAEDLREGGRAAKALFDHEMTCRGVTALWDDLDADEQAGWQESVDVVLAASRPAGDRPEALTPSADTKAAYIGEFSFNIMDRDEDGEEVARHVLVPWDTIKEIMAAIAARAATHSPAPMAGEVLKTASGEAVGIRDALRQEFRTASRGHGRAGTADWLDGPYMAMGDAADVYADLMLGRAASDVGEAFDLDGLKKLWRTGVETGRILQDTHPKAVQIVRDYQTVADAKYLSVKSRIDGGEEGLELTLAVALGLSHQAREIHSRLIAAHSSTQEGGREQRG